MTTRSATELHALVEATLGTASSGAPRARIEVFTGDPADEILRAASRRHADLIVLGTHGLTGPDRLSRGSISYHVLSHAVAPVLAHPPGWRPR
jgi:nucleotide-binding universal stress UspA family protein